MLPLLMRKIQTESKSAFCLRQQVSRDEEEHFSLKNPKHEDFGFVVA